MNKRNPISGGVKKGQVNNATIYVNDTGLAALDRRKNNTNRY